MFFGQKMKTTLDSPSNNPKFNKHPLKVYFFYYYTQLNKII